MADKTTASDFPDILGAITGGARININVVQVALAIRPRVIRAGKPFETILLVQNASDVQVDLSVLIHLPEKDAKGKKGRFVTKADKLVIGLEPAQVGYVILPVSTLPDTAVSPDYTISMDVQVKPVGDQKPTRIRANEGGDPNKDNLKPKLLESIEELSHLNWMVNKSSGLRSTGVEVKFGLMSGTVGAIVDLKAGWESLWTMEDLINDDLVIEKNRKVFYEEVITKLSTKHTYELLLDHTLAKFRSSGFELLEWEGIVIAKMLALILLYASPPSNMLANAGRYHLRLMLGPDSDLKNYTLPYWAISFLNVLNKEPRAAQNPIRVILHFNFEDLLQDALTYAFERVQVETDTSIGSTEERKQYIQQFLADYKAGELKFQAVYLPLVLGGVIVADEVLLPNDNMETAAIELREMIDKRREQYLNENTEGLFEMIDDIMIKVLHKYGYDAKRM